MDSYGTMRGRYGWSVQAQIERSARTSCLRGNWLNEDFARLGIWFDLCLDDFQYWIGMRWRIGRSAYSASHQIKKLSSY